uniref:Uncharacterized protein n=1 Tax=Ascaris lumbricoides TaxID=6252 RepID=A0A0M3HME3_ASCLU
MVAGEGQKRAHLSVGSTSESHSSAATLRCRTIPTVTYIKEHFPLNMRLFPLKASDGKCSSIVRF